MAASFEDIPLEKKIEFPIAENFQLGVSTGLALSGFVPVSIYPRWNFLLLAADQLVNHLDKMSLMTSGQYNPKFIIRVAVGTTEPVNPQHQHLGDFTESFKKMMPNVVFVELKDASQIMPEYIKAYERENVTTILVENHQS